MAERTRTAAVLGASGTWGRATSIALLERGFDVRALGRAPVPELEQWAARSGRRWTFAPFDLLTPDVSVLGDAPLDALFVCAASTHDGREALVRANYLGVTALVDRAIEVMRASGGGRIGLFLAQNARLGLRGLADYSASQAALWTWLEARQAELRGSGTPVTITRVIPPRAASTTQHFVSERSGHSAKLHRADARPLVDAVLAGRSRAGRRPLLAALAMLLR